MSSSPTARQIDRELDGLRNDIAGGAPLLSYLRYNIDLRPENVRKLAPDLTDPDVIESLSAMDALENMEILHKLGVSATERDVRAGDFAPRFDLAEE